MALRPGGFLLLLALLRWRDARARVLGTLALVPQLTVLYEALPVFLVCRSRQEGYALAALSWVVAFGQAWQLRGSGLPMETAAVVGWPWLLIGLYLPALALVLRQPKGKYLTM
jgi:hypothetical protein